MSHVLGLDYLTLAGLHPLDYIRTAARAGAQTVALPPQNFEPLPKRAARYSILEDAMLREDMRACLGDNGVTIGMIDGLAVWPGQSVSRYERSMEGLAALGVTMANTVSFDIMERSLDEFARLVELSGPYGITVVLESCPVLTVRTLAEALAIVQTVAMPNFKLLIDTMHVSLSGEAGDVASLDPGLIGYVQICDAALAAPPTDEAYLDLALNERMIPGEGELPLVEILKHVPDNVIISSETPLRRHLAAGVAPVDCARFTLEGARRVLSLASQLKT